MHDGVWDKSATDSYEVRGLDARESWGYGNIGTELSNVAEALGMRVVFYDKGGPSGPRQRTAAWRSLGRAARVLLSSRA